MRKIISFFLGAMFCASAIAAIPQIPPAAAPRASNQAVINQEFLNAWGDSLTAGNEDGSGTTYPGVLQSLTNYTTNNAGIGGQISTTIGERQGGVATTITLASNTLSSGSNSITALNGNAIVSMSTNAAAVQILSTPSDTTTRSIAGTLCGYVGTMTRTASGGPPSTAETYTFTPTSSAGLPISCAASSSFTVNNVSLYPQPLIIWAGRNNYASESQVLSDVAAMVAAAVSAGNFNYVVMSIPNGEYSTEQSGQTGYNEIIALNSALAAVYGVHYFDVRSYIVSQYNPANAADVIDHGNDVPPYSLRAVDESGTMTSSTLNTSSCSFNLSPSPVVASIITMGTEKILISGASGSSVTACTRGYAGTTAASYTVGQTYVGTDPLHFSGGGYTLVATYIYANYLTVLQGNILSSLLTPQNVNYVFGSPPCWGCINPGTGVATTLSVEPFGSTTTGVLSIQGNSFLRFQTANGASGNGTFLTTSGNGTSIILGSTTNSGFLPQNTNTSILGESPAHDAVSKQWLAIAAGTGGISNAGPLYDQSMVTSVPTTGNTVTLTTNIQSELINPAGTLLALTIAAPAAPTLNTATGGRVHEDIIFTQAITTATWTGFSGASLPTSITAGSRYGIDYIESLAAWEYFGAY